MEILSTQNPRIIRIKIHTNKNPPVFTRPFSIPAFRVSANLHRRRKSHLRKKLIEQQVRQSPHHLLTCTPEIPIHTPLPDLGISDDSSASNPHTSDDASAPLWNQLESWADQYKAKLHLNQDEILTTTLTQKPSPSVYHLNEPGHKISHATLSRVGVSVFSASLVFIALNNFFRKLKKGDKEQDYTSLEKEMLRRKFKARMAKDDSRKASVEVIQDSKDPDPESTLFTERPQLDKEHLMNSIVKANGFDDTYFGKIQEIRAMATHARQIECNGESTDNESDGKEVNPASFDLLLPQTDISSGSSFQDMGNSPDVSGLDVPNINGIVAQTVEGNGSSLFDIEKLPEKKSVGVKPRIIASVKEAREYLHKKEKKQEPEINNIHEDIGVKGSDGELGRAYREKWLENNFHEFEPLIEKIRGGFRNNYMAAREKVKEDINLVSELQLVETECEFEWMKDEKLREIVFQVRENELMGRDPFYLMDTQDKALFFIGLEKKVEKENEKLGHLHEYLHSNIENLDYGADGISLYDSPEKFIPRWKGPPPATTMSQEFLDDYLDQRKALFSETLGNLDLDSQNLLQSSSEKAESKNSKSSKTVIEGSDGSIKPGKKSGKEFWQHTKKWSRGFIDSYNAENDPEIKAAMKDIGKDLDRWITEKEIQDAADIMDKVPEKGKKFITEKINKLKREMELFGPQAVVSKYSEYGDEQETDYYWWLDLPFLLCIEMYIYGDGDQRIGFYSLEMASELELDPKPHHIIAFEDAGDCKNFCYVIQTHMEMLGNGNAFVVPQLPKDTYREAKANGFNVTVIRKGELKLDVDQTLEEVEEKIVEIGSKMYHDKIMKSRNVDVDSVMKGVFGLKKTTNRRRLKRPTK